MIELLHALTVVEQCLWLEMTEIFRRQLSDRWGYEPRHGASFEPLGSLNIWVAAEVVDEPDAAIYTAFFFGFDETSVRAKSRGTMQRTYSGVSLEVRRQLDEQHNRIPVNFQLFVTRGVGPTDIVAGYACLLTW